VTGEHHAPATVPPAKKKPRHLLNRRLGGPQSWSGCCGKENCLLPLLGFEPHNLYPVA